MDHADWLAGIDCARHRTQWCETCCSIARPYTHRSTVSAREALDMTRPARGSRKERLAEIAAEIAVEPRPTNIPMPAPHLAAIDGTPRPEATVWLVVANADASPMPEGHVASIVGFRGRVLATYNFGACSLVLCENFAYADIATRRLKWSGLAVVRFALRSSATMAAERLAA